MNGLENRLGQLQFEAFHGDIDSKTKKQLIEFAKELVTCAVEVLANIDQIVDMRLGDKHKAQQLKIDNLRQSMAILIDENKQLKDKLQQYDNRISLSLSTRNIWLGLRNSSHMVNPYFFVRVHF